MHTTTGRKRLNSFEAADYLGVKPETLQIWRTVGRYPLPYFKAGSRVYYFEDDLDAFIRARTYTHTGEMAAA